MIHSRSGFHGGVLVVSLFSFAFLLLSRTAHAGFTETLPEGAFMLDVSYNHSWLNKAYDNDGNAGPLIDKLKRYEPGGGLQGILTPNARVQYSILIPQLQYGILEDLSVGVGVPVVLFTKVEPRFEWEEGDYQPQLGRTYNEEDFWKFAESMGQPRPGDWTGNRGKLSDIFLGARYRWTHRIGWFRRVGLASSMMIMGAMPTGSQKDPEEVVAAGTTMWDLHSQGELNFHLAVDKTFEEALDGRLILGLDCFYEILFPHSYKTPEGEKHPLLLNQKLFVGDTYTIDPGDFSGFSLQTDVVPVKGPAWGTWITKGDAKKAKELPPLLTLSLRYTFIHLQQSDWGSDSDLWDWDQEKLWRPGYKNMLTGAVMFSFLRLGAPLQIYASYRSLSLIPGKNCRAADVLTGGIRVPVKFW